MTTPGLVRGGFGTCRVRRRLRSRLRLRPTAILDRPRSLSRDEEVPTTVAGPDPELVLNWVDGASTAALKGLGLLEAFDRSPNQSLSLRVAQASLIPPLGTSSIAA